MTRLLAAVLLLSLGGCAALGEQADGDHADELVDLGFQRHRVRDRRGRTPTQQMPTAVRCHRYEARRSDRDRQPSVTFDEFLLAELDALRRYGRVLAGDRQSGHDLVADVLVTAAGRWDAIAAVDSPALYVRRMLTNRHIDLVRRQRRFGRSTPIEDVDPPVSGDRTAGVEQRAYLDGLLRALPARQRAALVCRFYLGLPDEDIAAELGIGVSSVRSSIARALASLRTATSVDDVRSHLR